MITENKKLHEIFFKQFAHDNSKFLIPRLPFRDQFACRRVMDYAIISQDPSVPKVSIMIKPENTGKSSLKEIQFEDAVRAAKQLNWITLVFTLKDFEVRSWYVREQLEKVFTPERTAPKKIKPKKNWFFRMAN